jgi:LDH2 family malate/lactate/ureidoglycolate dehydrogenase
MKPFPGLDRAELPGGMEYAWEQENVAQGIPISDEHRQALEPWGEKLGVDSPYGEYEETRF